MLSTACWPICVQVFLPNDYQVPLPGDSTAACPSVVATVIISAWCLLSVR